MSDLKIYIIGPNLNDSMIRPWSVLGKYVRRCVIVYERMQFDKLVELCKRGCSQFKQLSAFIYQLRTRGDIKTSVGESGNRLTQGSGSQGAGESVARTRTGATSLFLHDESNLTITSEWLNRFLLVPGILNKSIDHLKERI